MGIRSKIEASMARKAKRMAKRKELFAGKPRAVGKAAKNKRNDDLWSEGVKTRDRYVYGIGCRIIGAAGCTGIGMVAYHIVPKVRGKATRWDLDNGVLACAPCNAGEHYHRDLYRHKHCLLFGEDFVKRLEEKARAGADFSSRDLDDIALGLRAFIDGGPAVWRASASKQEPHNDGRSRGDSQELLPAEPGPEQSGLRGHAEADGEGAIHPDRFDSDKDRQEPSRHGDAPAGGQG